MTLGEKLTNYRGEHGLSTTQLYKLTGVKPPTIFNIEHGLSSSPIMVKKLVDTLGDEFKEFLVYSKCTICGKPFLPKTRDHICCSAACSEEKNRVAAKNWSAERNKHKKIMQTKPQKFDWHAEVEKSKVSLSDYNQGARDMKLTYGQRQSQERLGSGF